MLKKKNEKLHAEIACQNSHAKTTTVYSIEMSNDYPNKNYNNNYKL